NSASWRVVIAIGLVWAILLGVGILFMPESPRWLLKRGRVAEAESSIARVRGFKVDDHHEHVLRDLKEMQDSVKYEQSLSHAGWLDCFRPQRKTLYRTLLGMSLQSLQQLTGANYFFYYGATVFNSVGIQDSFVTQIILGAVNFGCTFLGLYVMERFGRRVPLMIGGVWQACWLFVFAAAGTARDPTLPENQNIGKLMIVSACLFILGYASTWAPGIWILIGETFPTRTRAKQGALATASNWIWNFLIAFFTPLITRRIKYRYGFIFASCNLLGAIVVFFFLYESSSLSLEAVDVLYNDPEVKPWTSRDWQPPADYGYSGRGDLVDQTRAQEQSKPVVGQIEKAPAEGAEIPGVYDGKWGGSGEPLKAYCPSTGEHLGDVLTATPSETKRSLERSREAYLSIRNMPAPRRVRDMLHTAGAEGVGLQRDDLGALVSLEMGKIRTEGEGEVQEFVDICDYAVVPNPLGVVGVLSAFNFPIAVYGWNLSLSLAAGNATLWKPSPTTPLCAIATTKIISQVLERNGVDPAVAGLVCGREDVGKAVVASPAVDMVSFTGSEAVGKIVGKEVQDRFGKVLLELGGNNGKRYDTPPLNEY
ncbi:hexose transporter hxt1, partial [Ceratobasidium sp. 370]